MLSISIPVKFAVPYIKALLMYIHNLCWDKICVCFRNNWNCNKLLVIDSKILSTFKGITSFSGSADIYMANYGGRGGGKEKIGLEKGVIHYLYKLFGAITNHHKSETP